MRRKCGMIVAMMMMSASIALAVGGCSCQSGELPPTTGPETKQPGMSFEERVWMGVAHASAADDAGQREAERFFRDHGAEVVPVLIEMLGSDAGLTAGVEAMLRAPATDGAGIALAFAATHHAPELYLPLLKLALDADAELELRGHAIEILSTGGEPALDVVARNLVQNPKSAFRFQEILRHFPQNLHLRYWLRDVAHPDTNRREVARYWVKNLSTTNRRDDVLALLEALPIVGPRELPTTFDPAFEAEAQRRIEGQNFILQQFSTFRVWPPDDPWFVPALCQCVVSLRDQRIVPQLTALVWRARRQALIARIFRWHEQNRPEPGSPDELFYGFLTNMVAQLRVEVERFQGEYLPDVVKDPEDGTVVDYGADCDDEYVTNPRTGRVFKADSRRDWSVEAPRHPGRGAANEPSRLERFDAMLPILTGPNPLREGLGAALRDDMPELPGGFYGDEWWPRVADRLFVASPVVRALVACGPEIAGPAVIAALTDTTIRSGQTVRPTAMDWRVRIGGWLVLGQLGMTAQVPVEAFSAVASRSAVAYTDFEWLAVYTALALDKNALAGPIAEAAIVAPTLATMPPIQPRMELSAVVMGTEPAALLQPAWGWAIGQQRAATTPEFWSAPFATTDDADSGLTGKMAGCVTAWARLADTHEHLRDGFVAQMRQWPAARRAGVAEQVRWPRHEWALPALVAVLVDALPADPPLDLMDALAMFPRERTAETFLVLSNHPNVAVRKRALVALPPAEPWLSRLERALNSAEEVRVVAHAAAVRLLDGPTDSALRAADLLWREAPELLMASLAQAPMTVALPYLERGFAHRPLHELAVSAAEALAARNPSAEAKEQLVGLVLGRAADAAWSGASLRARLVRIAADLDLAAARPALRDICKHRDSIVVEAAARALTRRAEADNVPALLEILTAEHHFTAERRVVLRHLIDHPMLLREPGVVDALFLYLQQRDVDNLYVEASLALVGLTDNPDPRIAPELCAAYFRGVLQPLAVQQVQFIERFPTAEVARVMLDVVLTERVTSVSFAVRFLGEHYFRFPEIRDMMREAWSAPTVTYDQMIAMTNIFARPTHPTVLDRTWLDILINHTEYDSLPEMRIAIERPREIDLVHQPGLMPLHVCYALVMLADMKPPRGTDDLKPWLQSQRLHTVAGWQAWWAQTGRQTFGASAEAEYQARLAAHTSRD